MRYRYGSPGKQGVWILFLSCLATVAVAQQPHPSCRGAKVLSLQMTSEDQLESSPVPIADQLKIAPTAMPDGMQGRQLGLTILGPVLGSMDARDVATAVTCTAQGLTLTITSQRSANYVGAVHKNIPWRAKVLVVLARRQPSVSFTAVWKMKLMDGTPVTTAQTPPHPAVTYPLTTTLMLP